MHSRRRPASECESLEVEEMFAMEIPRVEVFPEANVSSLAYVVCGVGWSHFVEVEVIDIV